MWNYNLELKRWFHSSGASSENGQDDMPGEPEKMESAPPKISMVPNTAPKDCGCGGKKRQVR